jgi:hypothetical protein
MSPAPRHRMIRAVGCAVALVSAAGLLAACTTPRNTLGTNSSVCFKAIPVAEDAVEDKGTLVGTRLVPAHSFHRRLHDMVDARAPTVKTACVVAFHGHFRADQVKGLYGPAPPNGTAEYAIVVVSVPQNHLIGTALLVRAPLPLRHEVLGPKRRGPPVTAAARPGYVA